MPVCSSVASTLTVTPRAPNRSRLSRDGGEAGQQVDEHVGCAAFCFRSRGSGQFEFPAPIRPARASGAYEVPLKLAGAAHTGIFPGPPHPAFVSWTRRHRTRAFPLEKGFVTFRVRDQARTIRVGAPLIDVIHKSAIDPGFVQEAFARVIEYDPSHHTSTDCPVCPQLLYLPAEGPTKVGGVCSALG